MGLLLRKATELGLSFWSVLSVTILGLQGLLKLATLADNLRKERIVCHLQKCLLHLHTLVYISWVWGCSIQHLFCILWEFIGNNSRNCYGTHAKPTPFSSNMVPFFEPFYKIRLMDFSGWDYHSLAKVTPTGNLQILFNILLSSWLEKKWTNSPLLLFTFFSSNFSMPILPSYVKHSNDLVWPTLIN